MSTSCGGDSIALPASALLPVLLARRGATTCFRPTLPKQLLQARTAQARLARQATERRLQQARVQSLQDHSRSELLLHTSDAPRSTLS